MRFSYYTFSLNIFFFRYEKIFVTEERTYGNLPVQLGEGGESITRVCHAETS
jgi:hypothetical protein